MTISNAFSGTKPKHKTCQFCGGLNHVSRKYCVNCKKVLY